MKMRRLLSGILALLLMVSLLPIGVMADTVDNNPKGTTAPEIASDETMNQNRGAVTTNNGTLNDNRGTVTTNDGTVKCNLGLVETNNKNVNVNSHSVTTNTGEVITNGTKGTVTTNEKDVTYNKGNVVTNATTGTVVHNWGNITTNNGTVNTNETKKDKDGAEFKGVIETNNGTVKTNGEGGTVVTNAKDGEIETNNDTVGKKDEETGKIVEGTGNNGTIETNNGTVIGNNENGKVETNAETGTIEVNAGTVGDEFESGSGNFGTVNTNTGDILVNHNQVDTNAEGGQIYDNSGNLDINEKGAEVLENWGTIGANSGKVDFNGTTQYRYVGSGWKPLDTPAIVNNLPGGEVVENYGLVNNKAGGFLNDVTWSENPDDEEGPGITEYKQFEGEEGTYVGTWVDRGYIQNEDGSPEGFQNGGVYQVLKQAIQGAVMDLKEVGKLFNKDGYEVIGYTTEKDKTEEDPDVPAGAFFALDDFDGPEYEEVTVYSTKYEVKGSGGWLSLIWGKIKTAVKPPVSSDEPETKTVQNNIPTSLSAGQVKVGAYVRRGNLLFRIIEVTDNDIRVATVGKLSEQALADMMGFLKQHLSDAQIAKISGEPKLLEQELVTYFFGDSYEHIAFRAAKDLFE